MIKKMAAVMAVLVVAGYTGSAMAGGDAAAGEKVFKKCKACHAVGDKAKNKVGPMLNGMVGATAGSVEGYKYSKPMQAKQAEGLIWTEAELDAFLTKPKTYLKGTKMSFPGLKKEQQRADVIAYLATFQ